ncbi:MAG TPA: tRNA (5-methylaminomethyl-2-thiouridine)(34)-methyltransferase MnmD [Bacteroidales bacterium]|nr:tRNA (5-methylaminomethyl-2-thiouridine)(34)-methyltransferase MnmD [Bacteroidales bacterium]
MGINDNTADQARLQVTGDGSHTLYIASIDEHYHSHFGALTESKHIFINAGIEYYQGDRVSVLEVGFGTGLNALLTAIYAEEKKRHVTYVTLEKYPLKNDLVSELNHASMTGSRGKWLFDAIHEAKWESPVELTPWFTIHKKKFDLTTDSLSGSFDLIYFDAFGPDKQPEMWTSEVMGKVDAVTHAGTVFVTYSAKGSLRRMLNGLGFEVSLLPGPPGKRVITRAEKK